MIDSLHDLSDVGSLAARLMPDAIVHASVKGYTLDAGRFLIRGLNRLWPGNQVFRKGDGRFRSRWLLCLWRGRNRVHTVVSRHKDPTEKPNDTNPFNPNIHCVSF